MKKVLAIFLALALCLSCLPATVFAAADSGTCGDDLTWELTDDGILTISGTGPMTDYESEGNTAPWYSLRSEITSVVMEEGVASIGRYAFYNCSNLTDATIPDSVTSIGCAVFLECSSLTEIAIPKSVTGISDSMFYGCSSLERVNIPENVVSIGSSAFRKCSSLTEITISDSVTSIDVAAFSDCSSLNGIWVSEDNPNYYSDEKGVLFNKGKTTLIQAPGGMQGEYVIPDSVTIIDHRAFSGCSSLTGVMIPDSVNSLGGSVFSGCSSLTEITIPESVTSLGGGVFSGCSSLTDITLPASITEIPNAAFDSCSSLESITIPDSVTEISWGAFEDCISLTSITIPESVTKMGYYVFRGCSGLKSITIPESVTDIGQEVFSGCSSLESITIPESVTSIGNFWFEDCISLTSITIPESVTDIGQKAFSGCSSLTSITIPSGVTSIGWNAFVDCGSLTEIIFTGDAPTFGGDVFYGVTATAYYPADADWTAEDMQDYGGTITWEPYQHAHTWGEWTVVTDPTCTEKGTETRTCADCGEIETRDVDALGHETELQNEKDATCTEDGYTGDQVCTVCGETVVEGKTIDALGHVYDAVVTAPTCTERGYTTYTCIDGDDSYVDSYVDALEHETELQNKKDATCTEAGYTGDQVCTVCDEIVEQGETIDALGHDYDTVETAPTCTKQGYTTHTCSRCNDSYVDSYVDATGHEGNLIEDDDGTAHRICTICGITENIVSTNGGDVSVDVPSTLAETTDVEVEHVADTSDERYSQVANAISEEEEGTVQKVFDINLKDEDGENVQPGDETVTVKLPIEESSDDTEYKVYRVNDDGTTTDMNAQQQGECMVFETDHFSLYVVVKHTHNYERVMTAPTCTERGYTTYTCSTCDDSYVETYVEANGHSFGDWTVTTEPTCTEKGVETRCCAHGDAAETRSVKALGHDLSAATCTEEAKCRREGCGHTEEGTALGHSFTSYRSNNDAGCTTDGTKTAECRRCHDATDMVVDEGSAKGHDHAETWSFDEYEHWHACSACGDKKDAAGHDYGTAGDKCVVCEFQRDHVHKLTLVPAVAADCTTAGNKAYYTCSGCDAWFEDADGTVRIEDHSSVAIAALGHQWDDGVVTTEPTEEAEGVKTYTCERCGVTQTESIPALEPAEPEEPAEPSVPSTPVKPVWQSWLEKLFGDWWGDEEEECDHEYTSVVTDPTCEEDGYTTHTCTKCGDTYKDSYTDALGHQYEDGICTQCGKTEPVKPEKPNWKDILDKLLEWWK